LIQIKFSKIVLLWALLFIVWCAEERMYSLALQCDYSTSNGCGGAACNYELFTENAEIAKKTTTCKSTIWILVLLYVQIIFSMPKWNVLPFLDKPPWGAFHASLDLKLLTSKSSCKLGFWESQASSNHRQICWQTRTQELCWKWGYFIEWKIYFWRFYFPFIMFIKVFMRLHWGFHDHFPASLWHVKAILLLYL